MFTFIITITKYFNIIFLYEPLSCYILAYFIIY